jgi:hypothetical protein
MSGLEIGVTAVTHGHGQSRYIFNAAIKQLLFCLNRKIKYFTFINLSAFIDIFFQLKLSIPAIEEPPSILADFLCGFGCVERNRRPVLNSLIIRKIRILFSIFASK